jgi:hypothetical protein
MHVSVAERAAHGLPNSGYDYASAHGFEPAEDRINGIREGPSDRRGLENRAHAKHCACPNEIGHPSAPVRVTRCLPRRLHQTPCTHRGGVKRREAGGNNGDRIHRRRAKVTFVAAKYSIYAAVDADQGINRRAFSKRIVCGKQGNHPDAREAPDRSFG